jgi:pantoate--beta-alanine ligase
LLKARNAWRSGEKNAWRLRRIVAREIAQAPLARVDYIEVVDAVSIQPVRATLQRSLIAAAVYFGATRLIDNVLL